MTKQFALSKTIKKSLSFQTHGDSVCGFLVVWLLPKPLTTNVLFDVAYIVKY